MSEKLTLSRRSFIGGLLAAPAIVSAANLMAICVPWEEVFVLDNPRAAIPNRLTVYRKNGIYRFAPERLTVTHTAGGSADE